MPRPRSVTILAVWVLCLAAINLFGAANGVRRYDLLLELPLSLPPLYLIGTRAVWGLVFGLLALGLWRLKHWARLGLPLAYGLYLGQGWIERLGFGRSDYSAAAVPFQALLHVLLLALVYGLLLRRKVRRSFSA